MDASSGLPWRRVHQLLLEIGTLREAKGFCEQTVRRIYPLIPYDQARIYYLNDKGQVLDEILIGVPQRWSDAYVEYYSRIEDGRYGPNTPIEHAHYTLPNLRGGVTDWALCECDEFVGSYIRPQGIKHGAGFAFYDANGLPKSMYSLDRTSRSGYTRTEIEMLRVIQPHLDNLHRNLFVPPATGPGAGNPNGHALLTRREAEIAQLLCKGMTPNTIARRLCLSVTTVYKHIENIHTKLGVSNRQELLLKLLRNSGEDAKTGAS